MFFLYCIESSVELEADLMGKNLREIVTLKLEDRFIGRIVTNCGVPVAIYSLKILEMLASGDQLVAKVTVEMAVFRPFVGEILTAHIKKCSKEGLYVDMVFSQAFIPAINLAKPSVL